MRIIEDIKYSYSCGIPLEDFLQQLTENCRLCKYAPEIRLIGSSGCEGTLTPKNEWSLFVNSFKPVIDLKIISAVDTLNMTITCKLKKSIKYMNIVFNIVAAVLLILGTFLSKSSIIEALLTGLICLLVIWVFALGMTAILFDRSSKRALKDLIPEHNDTK